MSFVLPCLFCRTTAQVPLHAVNHGLRCRQCGGQFMLVPRKVPARLTMLAREEANVLESPGPGLARPKNTMLKTGPAMKYPDGQPLGGTSALDYFNEPLNLDPQNDIPLESSPGSTGIPTKKPRAARVAGILAILLGFAALFGSSALGLPMIVLPFSGLGLLIGLAAWFQARRTRPDWLFPGLGTGLSGGVLVLALILPSWLGPAFQIYRDQKKPDLIAIQIVPLPGSSGNGVLLNPEWIDASRAGLRQGGLNVRVADVQLVAADSKVFRKPPTGPAQKYLIVKLTIQRAASGREFAASQWGQEESGANDAPLTLTDAAGNSYVPLPIDLKSGSSGLEQSSGAFPVSLANPSFVFAGTDSLPETLRLEIPLAPWGGAGTFRFSLPATMIRTP